MSNDNISNVSPSKLSASDYQEMLDIMGAMIATRKRYVQLGKLFYPDSKVALGATEVIISIDELLSVMSGYIFNSHKVVYVQDLLENVRKKVEDFRDVVADEATGGAIPRGVHPEDWKWIKDCLKS